MKILIDGLTFYTPTYQRGIGKVFINLLKEVVFYNLHHEIIITAYDHRLKDAFGVNSDSIRWEIFDRTKFTNDPQTNAIQYSSFIDQIVGDSDAVFWHPNPFMLDMVLPYYATRLTTLLTVYDFIPVLEREMYLDKWDKSTQLEYKRRLRFLKNKKVHLACISETVAVQAQEFNFGSKAGINAIPIGIESKQYYPAQQNNESNKEDYMLLVGGDDPRKNMTKLVHAFCAWQTRSDNDVYLYVVCAISDRTKNKLQRLAQRYGIKHRVKILGRVTDSKIGQLTRDSMMAAMPSLSEGFGLPVAEAMACGVPVVASDIKAGLIAKDELIQQSQQFQWPIAGKKYSDLLNNLSTPQLDLKRLNVAFLTPWPPAKSGISAHAVLVSTELSKSCDLTIVADAPFDESSAYEFVSADMFDPDAFDVLICNMGNNVEYHEWIYRYCMNPKSLVIMHDSIIHPFLNALAKEGKMFDQYIDVLSDTMDNAEIDEHMDNSFESVDVLATSGASQIAKSAGKLVVHNQFGSKKIAADTAQSKTDISVLPLPLLADNPNSLMAKVSEGGSTKTPEEFVVGVFGFITEQKMIEETLDAVASIISTGFPLRLVLVGQDMLEDGELDSMINALDIAGSVTRKGFVTKEEYSDLLMACDLVVNLRKFSVGESSAVVSNCLQFGIPMIIGDLGGAKDIPGECVSKIAISPNVTSDLQEKIMTLLMDKNKRIDMRDHSLRYSRDMLQMKSYVDDLYQFLLEIEQKNSINTHPMVA